MADQNGGGNGGRNWDPYKILGAAVTAGRLAFLTKLYINGKFSNILSFNNISGNSNSHINSPTTHNDNSTTNFVDINYVKHVEKVKKQKVDVQMTTNEQVF